MSSVLLDLARDLRFAARRPEATVLLALDQTEELLAPDAGDDFYRLLRLLNAALAISDRELMIVATIRSDMLGLWQQHAAVRAGITQFELSFEPFPLGPMPLGRIPEVVRGPSEYVRLKIDDDLVDAIRRDIGTRDALPLLAYTLRELYERYGRKGCLTLREYEELGLLEGSIQRAADAALDIETLSSDDREALRAAFIPNLVRATESGGIAEGDLPAGGEPAEVKYILPMSTPMTTADDVLDSIRSFMAASPARRC